MKLTQQLLQVDDTWETLDGNAVYSAGCPAVWRLSAPRNCDLTAVCAHLRKALLEPLTNYAIQDAECPAILGNKGGCALNSARTPSSDVKSDRLLTKDRPFARSQESIGLSLIRQAEQRVSGLPPATEA
jgi:hypothetical protein